ncbi:MAG: HDIG domain-containing metalloprotein, partial [bacterium]
ERLRSRDKMRSRLKDDVSDLEETLSSYQEELESLRNERISTLEKKSETNREELLSSLEDKITSDIELNSSTMKTNWSESIETRKKNKAERIVNRTINRCDITTPPEVPSAVLKFPDDEAYQHFQEFYQENKEDLIEDIESDVRFDEDQTMAVVETLKPIQKEIAHRTLNNIIQQKKFNYELIPEGIERYTRQVESEQKRAAREALNDAGISNVPEELMELLGVLKFRTSYGQQQLVHSLEVAHLGSLMAEEIGADVESTRRAGILHDVGKAIDRQREQGHAVIGAELAEEAGESDVIVNAIGSHHGDMDAKYVESILVAAADAISGSRPGVRRENVSNYSERIEALRELAGEREGIMKVYAMNAGRELRIRVNRDVIKDQEMEDLAKSIAEDIESELTYSGKIKINAIRETKVVKKAKNN